MKNIIKSTLLATLILVSLLTNAQVEMSDTLFIQRNEKGKIEFARFKVNESSDRKMKNDIVFLKSILGAKNEDEFRLKSEIIDELEITHRKYQQYYKGTKVDNAEYLVHGKEGNIEVINGDFRIINIECVTPIIKEEEALIKAMEYVGAEKYKWEDEAMEKLIKQHRNNSNVTYYPEGELVIAEDNLKGCHSFKLSWQFTISSLKPYNEQVIFVDAINGEIIRDIPLFLNGNTPGTAQTKYSGDQSITCDSYLNGYRLYEVRNTTPGNNAIVHTRNCRNDINIGNAIEFTNTNTYWGTGSWSAFAQSQAALDAHWAVEKNLDYWKTVHSRNSLNNMGGTVNSYVHFMLNYNNAGWNQSSHVIVFGDGDGINCNPWTSLDIVAHEMGHGIIQFSTANLTPGSSESGALIEGFCDIWGACVKNWVNSSLPVSAQKSVWLFGRDIMRNPTSANCIRNMQNPRTTLALHGNLYPSKYQGTNWNTANLPHTNSTVLSHWFYLLCEGGTGTNDGITYSVASIGINKAEKIVYRTLTGNYLPSSANYSAARNAFIQAASDLYTACSPEVISVTNAWHAVGVGSQYTLPTTTISNTIYTSNTTINTCINLILNNNVKVQNNAKLTIDVYETTINGDFEIQLGSELEIK